MSVVITPPLGASKAITPDDLLRMGDEGKKYELVDGHLKELDVSFLSSYVAGEVYNAIKSFVKTQNLGWVIPEGTSFQCFPNDKAKVRRADTAFFVLERITPERATTEGHCRIAPDLVVEVTSPNDLSYDVNEKLEDWLGAGVQIVWIVDPNVKTVHIYRPDGSVTRLHETDSLTGEPVLPGFATPVADLFRLPTTQPKTPS